MSMVVNKLRGATVRIGRPMVNGLHSIRQGPILRGPTRGEEFLAQIDKNDALEIGPLNNPALHGPGVRYFDVLDQAALRAHAREEGLDDGGCPHIHYLSPTGNLAVVDRVFGTVFSSHAIEHQPDLVAHLTEVDRLLRTGGRYYLAIPDKRFCFDHFAAATTIDEVLTAHDAGRRVHTWEAVLRARLGTTHNDALRHWLGLHGAPGFFKISPERAEVDAARADAGEYVDVHAWTFTPSSFLAIVEELFERELIALKPTVVHQTAFAELEFFAVLERQ